jgi:hypothetical protein
LLFYNPICNRNFIKPDLGMTVKDRRRDKSPECHCFMLPRCVATVFGENLPKPLRRELLNRNSRREEALTLFAEFQTESRRVGCHEGFVEGGLRHGFAGLPKARARF